MGDWWGDLAGPAVLVAELDDGEQREQDGRQHRRLGRGLDVPPQRRHDTLRHVLAHPAPRRPVPPPSAPPPRAAQPLRSRAADEAARVPVCARPWHGCRNGRCARPRVRAARRDASAHACYANDSDAAPDSDSFCHKTRAARLRASATLCREQLRPGASRAARARGREGGGARTCSRGRRRGRP